MPTELEQRERGLGGLALVHVEVEDQRLGDLLADLHDRVERRHRILEHHRHLGAPHGAHVVLRVADDVVALVVDVTLADHVALGQQAHDRPRQDRLARAGLADHAEGLAPVEAERDAVDGADRAALGAEVRLEVDDPEQPGRAVLRRAARSRRDDLLAHRPPSLTSRYSRTRSPARLSAITVRNITAHGMRLM